MITTTFEEYKQNIDTLSIESFIRLHTAMMTSVRNAINIEEFYNEVWNAAKKYAGIRSTWLDLPLAEKVKADESRTRAHDSFIRKLTILARFLEQTGQDVSWYEELYATENRKKIGDFACFMVFVQAINSR